MPDKVFLPYNYAPDALQITIRALELDGNAKGSLDLVDPDHCQISLDSRSDWNSVLVKLEVSDPNNELMRVLPKNEQLNKAVKMVVVCRSSTSRLRMAFMLEGTKRCWQGQLSLLRDDLRGSVGVDVYAIRANTAERVDGYSWREGERIAASHHWLIYVDDRPSIPGSAIVGEWRNFEEDPDNNLRERQDCAWHLDLMNDSLPKIYLNEAIEGLRKALTVTSVRGRAANLRDVLSHSVLQPVLVTLTLHAIASSACDSVDELDGWKKTILHAMAKLAEKDQTDTLTVEAWLKDWNERRFVLVEVGVSAAVQRHLNMPIGASRLVSAMEEHING